MKEKPELKTCPFCGGKGKLVNSNQYYWGNLVICETCGVQMPPKQSLDEAIAEWNKRQGKL